MRKIGLTKISRVRNLLKALLDLSETLPTADERKTMATSLGELSAYLEHVQREVLAIPVRDDVASLIEVVNKLDGLLQRAEANPVAARALGIEKPVRRVSQRANASADEKRVQSLLQRFESMTIDQIREALRDDSVCSMAELRAITLALGLRTQGRMGRDALAQRFLTQLANARGYLSLSDRQESSEPA
jgi:hypothetical protein